ncbi:MAG: ComEC family competence protein [Endomicrobia bacterium]|nr:ComEC family competence protein [Endomicrobiia bacterium]
MKNFIILKRPAITIFLFYAAFLIFINAIGIFSPQKQSFLYHFTQYNKPVSIEGRVISSPEKIRDSQRFILKADKINDFKVNEKILVNSPPGYKIAYGDIINIEGKISKPKRADFSLVFDYSRYLARLGIYTVFNVYSFEYIESKPNPVKKFALAFRHDIIKKIAHYFKKAYADILKSVIIGDKTSLDYQTKGNFVDSGLMHILIVSGLHVGFVAGMILIIFKFCGLSLRKASLLSIPFVFLYALATGANPPALRAAIMFSSVLIALALDREPLVYNSFALSALLILIFQPQQLFTASFQMSYAATIGIVYFYRHVFGMFQNIKNSILKFFCGVFSVTVSAQIFLIPICMYYFGRVSLISFFSNIIVVPLVGIIIPLGFFFYFFTFIFSYIALAVSIIVSILLHYIISVANISASFWFSAAAVAKPALSQLILFYAFFFFITYFKDKRRFIFSGICILISLYFIIAPKFTARNKLIFNIYRGQNITTIQTADRNSHAFTLYQHTGKYDKSYISSFLQFLSFSGIRNPKISFIGFNEADVLNQITNREVIFTEGNKSGIFNMDAEGNQIYFDMRNGIININNEYSLYMKNNPSFYFLIRR